MSGQISINAFRIDFIEKVANIQLPFHTAKKKMAYLKEENGEKIPIHPKENNAIKKEMFLFDAFKYSNKLTVFEIDPKIEFSALKNSLEEETDNVNTVKRDWYALNKYYLEKAGCIVDDSKSNVCEIGFKNTFEEEGLLIFKGRTITLPFIWN